MIVSLVSCGSGCGSTWKWNLLPNVLCLVPAQLESLLDFLFGEHWIASVLFFFFFTQTIVFIMWTAPGDTEEVCSQV